MAVMEQMGGRGCGQDMELVDFLPCLILVRLILQPGRDSTNDLVTERETNQYPIQLPCQSSD